MIDDPTRAPRRSTLQALIVDDEPLARENIRALLEEEDDVARIDACSGGREAIRRILEDAPDLVFLDVQMPGVDGLDVLDAVGPERMPTVIFVTAHDEYALRAFDAAAVDYLLKPFGDERFRRALDRARRTIAAEEDRRVVDRLRAVLDARHVEPAKRGAAGPADSDAAAGADTSDRDVRSPDARTARAEPADRSSTGPTARRIAVSDGDATVLLDPADIDWIEAADYYARLHVGDRSYLLRQSLTELESRLDADRFVRIHRSTIVQVDRIHALRPTGRGGHEVELRDGTRLRLSRRRRAALERLVGRLG